MRYGVPDLILNQTGRAFGAFVGGHTRPLSRVPPKVLAALNQDHIQQIVDLEIGKVRERLIEHEMSLHLTDTARAYLAEKGYDPSLGARPLRRVIQTEVEDTLSEAMLADRFEDANVVVVDVEDEELVLRPEQTEGPVTPVQLGNGETAHPHETVLN